jgi:uncharacterized RDD family membrane protein YckC
VSDPSGAPQPPPGWYHASGDPFGTQRYWDGRQWIGGPQPAAPVPGRYAVGPLAPIGRTLAEPGRRIAARLIDIAIFVGIAIVMSVIALAIVWDGDSFDQDEYVDLTLPLNALVAVYEIAFIAWRGATPGKMAMGIEVVKQDGTSPPGLATSALRYVLGAVGLIPGVGVLIALVLFVVSFVFLFTDERRRTLNDRVASTYVVDRRNRMPGGWG